ncbi:protein STPG3 [Hemicordylus capensis]|uniref:protein STPG3 n=1 Tax=Hemicordylus capensis TaxID=884348 RepID=UPI0023046799|nr:protein STPG3 [Hemicordylus capensis]
MEFKQKQIKFLAQQFLDSSQVKKPRKTPLLYKRHAQYPWSRLSRESSAPPLFPDIYSARQNRRRASPEGRLTLVLNMDSPGPAAYSPPNVNYRETSAPSYTFGWKTPPREGGGRRAWQKSWFQSKHPFTKKADFMRETNWPSPLDYGRPLGSQPANGPSSPNFTMGQKGEFSFINKNTLNHPAPNSYSTDCAYFHILQRAPAIIISPAPQAAFRWASKQGTPGPAAYNVERGHTARLPNSPSFFIQGVRRPKKHETGPFSTL